MGLDFSHSITIQPWIHSIPCLYCSKVLVHGDTCCSQPNYNERIRTYILNHIQLLIQSIVLSVLHCRMSPLYFHWIHMQTYIHTWVLLKTCNTCSFKLNNTFTYYKGSYAYICICTVCSNLSPWYCFGDLCTALCAKLMWNACLLQGCHCTRCTTWTCFCVFTLQALKRFGAPLHDPDVDGNTPGWCRATWASCGCTDLSCTRSPEIPTYLYMLESDICVFAVV